jgi:hypothetical protein
MTQIEVQLKQWNLTERVDAHLNLDHGEALFAAGAVQWATLLLLHQKTEGFEVPNGKIQTAVNKIISAVLMIKPGSVIESHLLFPLFMAGVSSINKGDRLTIEYRLSIMERTIGFGNIFAAHQLLDIVWARRNKGEAEVGWLSIAREELPWMMLF